MCLLLGLNSQPCGFHRLTHKSPQHHQLSYIPILIQNGSIAQRNAYLGTLMYMCLQAAMHLGGLL